ncbi:LysR family transcriptional regulator [Desulfosporosinus sp. PR]|uniref:LysR family transcriptional regulator n=1 Tax=Candidatus Desulfosporosinus nitrosoreducens TaxID=3401928 RepID=UPI0027F6D96D|nr:LysR family transcriptional regulator [Desulfosporosinus sp. PR]MDQ7095073.1 LysR family transcriptional regulator [Desulfosporosinus sp. PR]
MDQRLLTFITVAEEKSFSRAANVLHITQPAVTQHIRNLECEFNVILLERGKRSVSLTKAGKIVFHQAKQILTHYKETKRLVDELLYGDSGSIVVSASYTFGEYILPSVLRRFQKAYPHITFMVNIVNSDEVIHQVKSREADIGIIETDFLSSENLKVVPFAQDTVSFIAAANSNFYAGEVPTLDELTTQTWILREKGSGTRKVAERVLEEFKITPAHILELGSTQIIKEAVEAGLGIALLSNWTVRKELTLNTLKLINPVNFSLVRSFSYIYLPSEWQTKTIQLFAGCLSEIPGF